MKTIITNLPSSEGCSWKEPRSIHRREPRTLGPTTNTITINVRTTP